MTKKPKALTKIVKNAIKMIFFFYKTQYLQRIQQHLTFTLLKVFVWVIFTETGPVKGIAKK